MINFEKSEQFIYSGINHQHLHINQWLNKL